jgi:hypothetical protein
MCKSFSHFWPMSVGGGVRVWVEIRLKAVAKSTIGMLLEVIQTWFQHRQPQYFGCLKRASPPFKDWVGAPKTPQAMCLGGRKWLFDQERVIENTGRSKDLTGNSEWNDHYYIWSSVQESGRKRPGVCDPIYQEIVTDLFWYSQRL